MRRTTLITTVALAAALAVPAMAPAAPYEYMYSSEPDSAQARSQNTQDLRSPDARDAASVNQQANVQDLRSPDARDAGREVKPVPVVAPTVEIREAPGFDWGDASIGAAAILALCSIAAGLLALTTVRRRRRVGMPAH
jgi:hypothetical protein